jgi:hypothetical protein
MLVNIRCKVLPGVPKEYNDPNPPYPVFCPCRSALVGIDHHSAKKVLILTMKLWKMKKSDFDHEIINFVEILGKTLPIRFKLYDVTGNTGLFLFGV